ncbi:glycoside hydrolase family 127 protein [Microbacterium sp. 18062]|uniref:glycoside hydrolase family 127 protein n=1 Tax=Microbacterium sp. 18062 TaxID=2681410 RepID=UPI001356E369|nr:beta-L-arabinofuranosidase domain-containing protein [Microbacterium sp. 18062]
MSTPLAPALPVASGALRPVSLTDVRIAAEGFWGRIQRLNRDAILPHCDHALERVGWIGNFRAAANGTLATERVGRLFTDSEIYKTMEAMAWESAREPSPALLDRLDELTGLLAAAQLPDGYLNTYYGYEGGPERYTDFEWGHELYCDGHLLQAAVAVVRAGGPAPFLGIARRLADHVCEEFGEHGRQTLCGHPEIETALVELYRATGEASYLEQARLFVERRGHRILDDTMYKGRDYYQDNVPVREAEVLVGHSVRALYLAAGAIDVAVETGDEELLGAVQAQYDRTLQRRTYLTGGMGSNHHGETYGDDFELPSERAYAETCAAVASVHVAWRLLLATGEERYADVIERTLYNSVISSPSVDGRSFFYVNALQRRSPGIDPEPGVPSLRRTDGRRADWFTTSCCPTNLARTFASLSAYLVTTDDSGVQLHQYAAGTVDVAFGAGRRARLEVETEYPTDGVVAIRVIDTDDDEWALTVRVPAWARDARVVVDDAERTATPGAIPITRRWRAGDVVTLHLDVAPRWVHPDPRIDGVRGSVAVERGPLVYALESLDPTLLDLDRIVVDTSIAPRDAATPIPGMPGVTAVTVRGAVIDLAAEASPYDDAPVAATAVAAELALLPYYLWANRGPSTMRVWLPRADVAATVGAVARGAGS